MARLKESIISLRFPDKLWEIVDRCKTDAISWGADGTTFIFKYPDFEQEYMSGRQYFKTEKISSFIRQLNLYGFVKIREKHAGGRKERTQQHEFYHARFVQDRRDLLECVSRNCIREPNHRRRSTRRRRASNRNYEVRGRSRSRRRRPEPRVREIQEEEEPYEEEPHEEEFTNNMIFENEEKNEDAEEDIKESDATRDLTSDYLHNLSSSVWTPARPGTVDMIDFCCDDDSDVSRLDPYENQNTNTPVATVSNVEGSGDVSSTQTKESAAESEEKCGFADQSFDQTTNSFSQSTTPVVTRYVPYCTSTPIVKNVKPFLSYHTGQLMRSFSPIANPNKIANDRVSNMEQVVGSLSPVVPSAMTPGIANENPQQKRQVPLSVVIRQRNAAQAAAQNSTNLPRPGTPIPPGSFTKPTSPRQFPPPVKQPNLLKSYVDGHFNSIFTGLKLNRPYEKTRAGFQIYVRSIKQMYFGGMQMNRYLTKKRYEAQNLSLISSANITSANPSVQTPRVDAATLDTFIQQQAPKESLRSPYASPSTRRSVGLFSKNMDTIMKANKDPRKRVVKNSVSPGKCLDAIAKANGVSVELLNRSKDMIYYRSDDDDDEFPSPLAKPRRKRRKSEDDKNYHPSGAIKIPRGVAASLDGGHQNEKELSALQKGLCTTLRSGKIFCFNDMKPLRVPKPLQPVAPTVSDPDIKSETKEEDVDDNKEDVAAFLPNGNCVSVDTPVTLEVKVELIEAEEKIVKSAEKKLQENKHVKWAVLPTIEEEAEIEVDITDEESDKSTDSDEDMASGGKN